MNSRLQGLIEKGRQFINACPEEELSLKPSPHKWSKKEILGHLIDSGINNLQRFTNIHFEEKPILIRRYNQDALVKVNDYQHADTKHLLRLWYAINERILNLMEQQNADTLAYQIQFEDGNISNLQFLMEEYIDHLEHHLNQIFDNHYNSANLA